MQPADVQLHHVSGLGAFEVTPKSPFPTAVKPRSWRHAYAVRDAIRRHGISCETVVAVVDALADKSSVLVVRTREAGDFSTYRLRLVDDAAHAASDPFAVTEVLAG